MKIRFSFYLMSICIFLFSCESETRDSKAIVLLEKSAEAHGGQERWSELRKISFKKWTILLDSLGNTENETNQLQSFQLKPQFQGEISWTKDSLLHVSTWDGSQMSYFMGENEVKNQDFLDQRKSEIDAAFYVLAQPWKLLQDPNAKLQYLGEGVFDGGKKVLTIEVTYGEDSDIWWYYFDPESFLIVGNEVQLSDHRSLIINGQMEEVEGMMFHGARTSYRVDDQGRKLYVRARYRYSDYELEFD
ncbi:DUF6503 family protein [Algoriphagus sediminis]|uniref:Lipoprotein n=1 Tax=Algoriphagus sediminis TaxID=3057113 RepID=A0ABT7Y871_9BACT|nr:DUF6503 family protein [Algoriphagus sediminis]MDN3202707.1 hypothetical protein [Algoriphagus sediminis]